MRIMDIWCNIMGVMEIIWEIREFFRYAEICKLCRYLNCVDMGQYGSMGVGKGGIWQQ